MDQSLHELVVASRVDGSRGGGVVGVDAPRVREGDIEEVEDGELGGELEVEGVSEANVDVESRGEGREDRHGVADVLFLVLAERLAGLRVVAVARDVTRVCEGEFGRCVGGPIVRVRVGVEEARGDEGHELGRGRLRAVLRTRQGDGVAEQEDVRDADERTRAVLVLGHHRAPSPEEVDALELVEVARVVVAPGRHGGVSSARGESQSVAREDVESPRADGARRAG